MDPFHDHQYRQILLGMWLVPYRRAVHASWMMACASKVPHPLSETCTAWYLLPQLLLGSHYTAGWTGAMWVKFLAQGNNNRNWAALSIEPGNLQLPGQFSNHLTADASHRDTQTHRDTQRDTHRHTDTDRQTHRHRHRHTDTHTQTHTQTHRHTHTHLELAPDFEISQPMATSFKIWPSKSNLIGQIYIFNGDANDKLY